MTTCPVQLSFQDLQPESPYEASSLVQYLYDELPRLLDRHDEETTSTSASTSTSSLEGWIRDRQDSHYGVNLSTIPLLISLILLLWVWLLVILSTCGYDKVGLWSGRGRGRARGGRVGGGTGTSTVRAALSAFYSKAPFRRRPPLSPLPLPLPLSSSSSSSASSSSSSSTASTQPQAQLMLDTTSIVPPSESSTSASSSSLATRKRSNFYHTPPRGSSPNSSTIYSTSPPSRSPPLPPHPLLREDPQNEDYLNNNNNTSTYSTSWILDLIRSDDRRPFTSSRSRSSSSSTASHPDDDNHNDNNNNDNNKNDNPFIDSRRVVAVLPTLPVSSSTASASTSSSTSSSSSSSSSLVHTVSHNLSELTTTFSWDVTTTGSTIHNTTLHTPTTTPMPVTRPNDDDDDDDDAASMDSAEWLLHQILKDDSEDDYNDDDDDDDDNDPYPAVISEDEGEANEQERITTNANGENHIDQAKNNDKNNDNEKDKEQEETAHSGTSETASSSSSTTTEDLALSFLSELMPPPSTPYPPSSSFLSSPTLLRHRPMDLNTSFPIPEDTTIVLGIDETLDHDHTVAVITPDTNGVEKNPLPGKGFLPEPTFNPTTLHVATARTTAHTTTTTTTHTTAPLLPPSRPLFIARYHKSRMANTPRPTHPPSHHPQWSQQEFQQQQQPPPPQLFLPSHLQLHHSSSSSSSSPPPLLVTDDASLLGDVSGLVIQSTHEHDLEAILTTISSSTTISKHTNQDHNQDSTTGSRIIDQPPKTSTSPTTESIPLTSPIAPQLLAEISLAGSDSTGLLSDDDDDRDDDDPLRGTDMDPEDDPPTPRVARTMTTTTTQQLSSSPGPDTDTETKSPAMATAIADGDDDVGDNGIGMPVPSPSTPFSCSAGQVEEDKENDEEESTISEERSHDPMDKNNKTTTTIPGRPSRETQSTHLMNGRSSSGSTSSSLNSRNDDEDGDDSFADHPEMSHEQTEEWNKFEAALSDWQDERRKIMKRLICWRNWVVVCCIALFGTTIVGAVNGALSLNAQRKVMVERWYDIQSSALQLEEKVLELVELQSTLLETHLASLWPLLDEHCPLVQKHLCSGVKGFDDGALELEDDAAASTDGSCNVTGIPLQEEWEAWLDVYVSPSNAESTLNQSRYWDRMIRDTRAFIDLPVESSLEGWNVALWATVACNLILSTICLSIVVAIGSRKISRLHYHLASRSMAIVYWVTVVLAWIFGICFWVGTVLTVDTCMSPDPETGRHAPYPIARLLLERNIVPDDDATSILPEFWNYHMDGCRPENYPGFLNHRINTLGEDFMPVTTRLVAGLVSYTDLDFLQSCGTSMGPLRSAATAVNMQLCIVTASLEQVRESLGCNEWYPWYDSMVNEAVCEQSSNAFVWCSTCQMAILFLAFFIWTFRASFTLLAHPIPMKTMLPDPPIVKEDIMEPADEP